MAIPTSAILRAAASVMLSPTIAQFPQMIWIALMKRVLWRGVHLDKILSLLETVLM
jgi:hypothetical protein